MGLADKKLFVPLWSDRILEEWARAAARLGAEQEIICRGEIAVLRANWPEANIVAAPEIETGLYLPDANDVHVLAAAISSESPLIITANLKDFPQKYLSEFGLTAVHPDMFLCQLFGNSPDIVAEQALKVKDEAERLSGQVWPVRKLLKKARLPRFGKTVEFYVNQT